MSAGGSRGDKNGVSPRRARRGWAGPPVLTDAWVHAVNCHPDPALASVDRILARAAITGDQRLASEAEMVAAIAYINVGDAHRCLARVTRALESPGIPDDAGFRGWATTLAGAALLLLERLDEGLETLDEAETLLEQTRVAEPRVAHAYGNLGLCRSRVQLFEAASESYDLALELDVALELPRAPDLHGRAENLLFWGLRLEHAGDLDGARERYGQAVQAFEHVLGEPEDQRNGEHDLAVVGMALAGNRPLGEGTSADPAGDLDRAREAAVRSALPEAAYWLTFATAAVQLRLGDPSGALAAVDGVGRGHEGLWHSLHPDRLFTVSACYEARGDTTGAFDVYRAFHRRTDEAAYRAHLNRGAAALDRVSRAHLADEYEQRARAAVTDPLTGLANRRRLDTRLDELVAAAGPGRPLALVVVDIDGLHEVNQRFGRHTGDDVLRAVASMLDRDGTPHDLAARLGGDEFALLCPGIEPGTAQMLRDSVGASVSSYPWSVLLAPGLRVTVTVGVASWSPGTRGEDLLERAYSDLSGHDLSGQAPSGRSEYWSRPEARAGTGQEGTAQPSFDASTAS